ncbi:uncharacterized protein M421DRAFT_425743 [Didymella exigua CBS 183.55]|uniref:DUF4484 domain-containing protein n=1 Tax=Didymella exigua CBS 183.55 TaxID=1150837 RepID=A0A6A5R877_9PLEO|nr:uncharacterized protein M421DRAFT_425743 [Didymella exigua CBS 183.55]KAF1923519.1 hypothetical protein M421DRAFT_425743 [Didymella exigua CBS 183.55]
MSASTHSSDSDVDAESRSDAPQVEALFLIRFDKKVGYTIAWKRTANDTDLDGVEFKSLPSGLHSHASDLVYFTHTGYAGLSAFARGDASDADRNANFVSVGILVRRDGRFGRLGRAWLLAGKLEQIAAALAKDETVAPLEDFWADQTSRAPTKHVDSKRAVRDRAISTATAVPKDEERLPAYHPALAILQYLALLGPLVFRLQQAALLRKRILFVGSPPVRTTCEFVYNLSVLSSISPRDAEHLAPGTEDLLRLPSLFSIGVHDIPYLEELRNPKGGHTPGSEPAEGWVACTTDEIIATKQKLYDIVVEMPHSSDAAPQQRQWPKLRTSAGDALKASQRDVARYKLLHRELWKHHQQATETFHDDDEQNDDAAPLISHDEIDAKRADDDFNDAYDDTAVEPTTWSRLAYQGFMWWASAGERDAHTTAERELDRDLVGDIAEYADSVETAVIAYFHRQSSLMIKVLSQLLESEHENEEGEGEEGDALWIERDDLSRMGLDTWSEADRAYVQEFGSLYFGRRVEIRGNEVDCCGLRVPML